MKKYDILSGLFLLALSLGICAASLRLNVGTLSAPRAGFFPLLTGMVLGVFSILIVIQARKTSDELVKFWAPEANKRGIYLTFFFILVYALLLERLGFVATTILFFVLVSRFVFGFRWSKSVFFALVTSFATYLVFTLLLRAPLPSGIVERMF
jgi:putative tricarboxylic transport membrane protein